MQIDLTLHVRETYVVPAASAKIAGSFRRACYDITIEAFARVTGPLCSSFAYLNRNTVHIVAKTTPWMTHDRHPIDHCVAVFDSIHRLFAYSLHHTVFILHSVCPRSCDLFFPRSLSLSLSLSLYSRSLLLFDVFRFVQNSVGISIVEEILIPILEVCVNSLLFDCPYFHILDCIYLRETFVRKLLSFVRSISNFTTCNCIFYSHVYFTIMKLFLRHDTKIVSANIRETFGSCFSGHTVTHFSHKPSTFHRARIHTKSEPKSLLFHPTNRHPRLISAFNYRFKTLPAKGSSRRKVEQTKKGDRIEMNPDRRRQELEGSFVSIDSEVVSP